MRFNHQTDYAFRVLIYLLTADGRNATVSEIAEAYKISLNHLNKVAQKLASLGVIEARRGRLGGLWLRDNGLEWPLGKLARAMEPDCEIAQCTGTGTQSNCAIFRSCILRGILASANKAFYDHLDQFSVADLCGSQTSLNAIKKDLFAEKPTSSSGPSPKI